MLHGWELRRKEQLCITSPQTRASLSTATKTGLGEAQGVPFGHCLPVRAARATSEEGAHHRAPTTLMALTEGPGPPQWAPWAAASRRGGSPAEPGKALEGEKRAGKLQNPGGRAQTPVTGDERLWQGRPGGDRSEGEPRPGHVPPPPLDPGSGAGRGCWCWNKHGGPRPWGCAGAGRGRAGAGVALGGPGRRPRPSSHPQSKVCAAPVPAGSAPGRAGPPPGCLWGASGPAWPCPPPTAGALVSSPPASSRCLPLALRPLRFSLGSPPAPQPARALLCSAFPVILPPHASL